MLSTLNECLTFEFSNISYLESNAILNKYFESLNYFI